MFKKLISSTLIICILCISYPFTSVHASSSVVYTIVFETITCVKQEDITGMDDPIIEVDGNVLWDDKRMESGDEYEIDEVYQTKNDHATIKLKEGDYFDPDDILGTKIINLEQLKNERITILKFRGDGAYYQIVISVISNK